MQMQPSTIAKVVTICLLLLALAHWPYLYYQLLRWIVCSVAAYSAYQAYEKERNLWVWIFGALAVLFNPIQPIHLSRETWQFFDITAAGVMLASLLTPKLK